MKKRNLLVMLLVAIAAFSLMSCDASPKNERGPVPECKIEVKYPTDMGYDDNIIVCTKNGMTTYISYGKYKRDLNNKEIPSDERWYISGTVYQFLENSKDPIGVYAILEKWKNCGGVHFTSFVTGNNIYGEEQPGCMKHIDGMYNLLSNEELPSSLELLPMNCGWIAIVQDLNDSSVMDLSQELYVDFIDERNVPDGYEVIVQKEWGPGYSVSWASEGNSTVKITEMSPLTTYGPWKIVDSLPPISEEIKKTIDKNWDRITR